MLSPRRFASLGSPSSFLGAERTAHPLLQWAESLIEPASLLLTLLVLTLLFGVDKPSHYIVLGVIVSLLTFPGRRLAQQSVARLVRDVTVEWTGLAAVLVFFGIATGAIKSFTPEVAIHWLWLAPAAQVAGHLLFRLVVPKMATVTGLPKRAIVVGCNDLGRQLASEINSHPMLGIALAGYFDDRARERLGLAEGQLLGRFAEVARFVKENKIDIIYLALPMASQPRILALLDGLRDTTASIYFVPDIFVTDLIQARMDAVGRMPVVAVCETPFSGLNGVIKRSADVVLSSAIVILISPVLLAIALMVKMTSPGPVIFRQRRYGLDGEEIVVYKFRSMTVCEDGPNIAQAQKGDSRITPLGQVLRKTSLDELPQFINVLQGRMSIVGPRPHAISHNEMYRQLVKGYMIRHKVKPGITGWAQVNGFRGETDTLQKMEARINCDLDYLRHWSLQLDLMIIARTVALVFRDAKAY